MAKPNFIELPGCEPISIIFEDRSVIAIDKPRGWMLVPDSWRRTNWNLQTAIDSSIRADDFWARSRNLRYLRHVHRLDAEGEGEAQARVILNGEAHFLRDELSVTSASLKGAELNQELSRSAPSNEDNQSRYL